jgi:hypothetical protein
MLKITRNYRFFIAAILALLGARETFAQGGGQLALLPFWGSPPEIIAQFGFVLEKCVRDDGTFAPFRVNMNNLPPDVPPGGFPPYVCPSPSITGDASFSLTGEIMYDAQTQNYRLRLYLWEIKTSRLVYTDELSAKNREECETYLPPLLDWLFSWLGGESAAAVQTSEETAQPRETPQAPSPRQKSLETASDEGAYHAPSEEPLRHLLYIALRAGSSFRFYSRTEAQPFVENSIIHYYNFLGTLQATYYFLPSWAVQAEIVFTTDFAPFTGVSPAPPGQQPSLKTMPMSSSSLLLPIAVKGTIWYGIFNASALGGIYFTIPLGQMNNELLGGSFNYSVAVPIGITAGVGLGVKAGMGNIILDLRWGSDLSQTIKDSGEQLYQRSMLALSLGYEIGLFQRKPR